MTWIRTQERVAPLPVFKTGAFNRSAILPNKQLQSLFNNDYRLKNNLKLKLRIRVVYCFNAKYCTQHKSNNRGGEKQIAYSVSIWIILHPEI